MFFPDYVFRFLLCSQLSTVVLLWAVNGSDHCPDSFDCGSLGSIRFPVTKAGREGCGALAIHGCDDHMQQFHFINIEGKKFQVAKIEQWRNNVYIIDKDLTKQLENNSCKAFDHSITLPPTSPLGFFSLDKNIIMFKCERKQNGSTPRTFLHYTSCGDYDIILGPPNNDGVSLPSLPACPRFQLPIIDGYAISANPFAFLTAEFPITFNPSDDCAHCQRPESRGHDETPGGRCFLDSKGKFNSAKRKDWSWAWKLGLMLGVIGDLYS